jgi:Fur family peroxide stress response transcriptional regulator
MEPVEALVESLRRKGLKITPQRRAILELLRGDRSHPTAEAVYRQMLATMPDVSRTTVYNTLRELVDLDALAPVDDKNEGGRRYDTNTDNHHHLSCIRCHALIDLNRDFEGVGLPAEDRRGYRIVKHQITFYGYCPDCQAG